MRKILRSRRNKLIKSHKCSRKHNMYGGGGGVKNPPKLMLSQKLMARYHVSIGRGQRLRIHEPKHNPTQNHSKQYTKMDTITKT